jgi:apolipoprotein N-acyltransferase
LSVLLLTLSLAPVGQFYLAYVALTPFFLMIARCPSAKSAFFWGWGIGTATFVANMWWLCAVTVPGTIALLAFLGLYWGLFASIVHGAGLLKEKFNPIVGMFLIACIWVACELLRGTLLSGLPWIYIGHTQTPVLLMCQIADVSGVYGVSFWVVTINALLALFFLRRSNIKTVMPAGCVLAVLTIGIALYGFFRIYQTHATAGPTVLVIQPNIPQDNGEKGAPQEDLIDFHITKTREALEQLTLQGRHADLVVWSETMMPPLNPEARAIPQRTVHAMIFNSAHDGITKIAQEYHTSLIVGSLGAWDVKINIKTNERGQQLEWLSSGERRNSAFMYNPDGTESADHYDKIHLVPFGEFIPFKKTLPFLFRFFLSLSPYDSDYTLEAGSENALTVFQVPMSDKIAPGTQMTGSTKAFRVVTPICFEDIVAPLVGKMFRGADGTKRADAIVNITNDGWFGGGERQMHLQCAVFRSIENRVPTARSVNTGVSAFIDSTGKITGFIPAGTKGWSAQTLALDDRMTLYMRFGDVFGWLCVIVTGAIASALVFRSRTAKRKEET